APESARGIEVQGEVEPVTIALREAVAISGRVIRADGTGVPDVSINAFSAGGASATTGPDGSFTIDELAPGTVQLMALKTVEFIREMRTVEAPSSNVEIKIPPGGTIRGRVLEKATKKPITDFRVGPSGERRGTGMRMITPPSLVPFRSEDGSFELTNVPVGPTEIVAEAGGYVTGTANANVEEGKPADLTILLEAGTRVFGRVTSPEGTPLAGASVSLVANEDEIVPMVTRRSTMATTDANGEYTIAGIAAGERSFRAAHETYPALVKEANVSGSELRLDLQFPRGTDVTGVVVRDSGEPVAGAAVSASTALQGATSKATTTDSNGNFRIEGLTPGRYTFFARTEGGSETLRDVDIATSGPIRITMKTGGVVSGRVSGLQASELSSATVNVSSPNGYASASVRNDGTFRVEGAPVGSVRVVAISGTGIGSRRQTAPKAVDVTAGGETYVDLDFGTGNRVSGRVTRGGSPVGGANVLFQLKAGSAGAGGSTRTNGQGEYSIEGLEDGVYNVMVMDMATMASHRTDYTVSGGGSFDIAMSAAALRGRVIDRETQEGISGVSVQLDSDQASGMRFPPIQTDGSGGFRLEGVAPGNYRVRASRAGYGQEVLDVSVAGDSEQDVELRMSRSDGVEIRVVDRRDGRALSAMISVADPMGRLALEEYLSQSNKKLSLAPGVYRAAISVSGYAPTVADIRSPGGPYTIALSPGGSLRIESSSTERRRARIVDSSGRPIVRGR
ncbi:MAG TPA: carboxypeptidase regulatory-like domain-containing protein, partial [Thermoanaerobaculia bacterium]|nr:carboxypeptidase regulatory-like domain-containing protein [Thermoanaerobaculia bacterium]